MDKEGMEKEYTLLVTLNNLIEKEKHNIDINYTQKHYQLPPWKITNKIEKYEYIKPNLDFKIEKNADNKKIYKITKNIVLNNILTEKQMNDLQNIPLNKKGIISLNDYNYYNDDFRTLEEWQSLPVSNYRFEIDNGLGGAKDTFVQLLANKKLTTEDRENLLDVDRRLFNGFQRYKAENPSFQSIQKPKPKPKSKSKYRMIHDEDENNNNVNIINDNNLLTVNSPEAKNLMIC
jgi:integrase